MSGSVLGRKPPPADLRLIYGDAPEQFGDLRLPTAGTGPFPAIAFIHGGFWRAQYDNLHTGHLCAAFAESGIASLNLEYRRLGNEGGGLPGTFQDVAAGLHHFFDVAPKHNIDQAKIIVAGHSAGGHLALWAAGLARVPAESEIAAEPLPLRAAVSLAGVVDLREAWRLRLSSTVVADLLGGSPDAVPARYAAASPIELVPIGVKQLLVHGTEDDIVPISLSEGYVESATAAGDDARLLALTSTDHFALIDPESTVWPRLLSAVLALFND